MPTPPDIQPSRASRGVLLALLLSAPAWIGIAAAAWHLSQP